jgi:hypothetical protein
MGITHVIRGDDHVNNTPRQINILQALARQVPLYAHLSMILGDDGQKLSKRHGAVSVMQYDDEGYLPEAVLNYLARLGWSHGDDEIFSMPAVLRVVRPRPHHPVGGAVQHRKAELAQCALPQARRNGATGRRCPATPEARGVTVTAHRRWRRSSPAQGARRNLNELADLAKCSTSTCIRKRNSWPNT